MLTPMFTNRMWDSTSLEIDSGRTERLGNGRSYIFFGSRTISCNVSGDIVPAGVFGVKALLAVRR